MIKKKLKKKKTTQPVKKPKRSTDNICTSEEEFEEAVDDPDDISTDDMDGQQGKEVQILSTEDIKAGDFVLVKIFSAGTKVVKNKHFKYVANVLMKFKRWVKSINKEKTEFVYIDNDISQIEEKDIIGKLPTPSVKEINRTIVTVFPGSVNTEEKL